MARNKTSKKSLRRRGPKKVSVTMYNVGFGDCFLLTFHYVNGKNRRVLIDCGSSSEKKEHMSKVVDQLIKDCQGHVDVIVATHRHKDHISAFGLAGLGAKLKSLKPDVVIQPWTEHPEAEEAALEAPSVFTQAAFKHMAGLKAVQDLALGILESPERVLAAAGPTERKYLTRLASLSIKNKKAVDLLGKMGKKRFYVYAGGPSGIGRLLPGVRVSVLGPPTLKQSERIRKQTQWDEEEFWKLRASLSAESRSNDATACGQSAVFPHAETISLADAPSYVRWVTRNVDNAQLHNMRQIVRVLDNAMNNTSVILLFEVGGKGLLFPGDAQLENWQYALGRTDWSKRLSKTVVYKVGHHGSTNATPQTLWDLFAHRSTRRKKLTALMSTEEHHHNNVPRKSLVDSLKRETVFHTTQGLRAELSITCVI